jgi:hypothetical protein
MTKKFWADWRNRIGETKNIYGWCSYETHDGKVKKYVGGTLVSYLPFKILSAKFNGNTVDLKIEVTSEVAFSNRHHVENKYITLHRNEISRIIFNKY